ncbi:MAG: hypothetical protein R3E79_58745 [Caldilineaceae bacterium]
MADLVIVDDLQEFRPRRVYAGGRLVADQGALLPAAWTTAGTGRHTGQRWRG